MHIKKVGFLALEEPYLSQKYMTKQLKKAFEDLGIETIFYGDLYQSSQEVLLRLMQDAPDFTVSFGPITLWGERALCDLIETPHLLYLVDPSHGFFSTLKSPYAAVSCIDALDYHQLHASGVKRSFYLPLAIEKDFFYAPEIERSYEVIFLGSCWDYKEVEARWRRDLLPKEYKLLLQVAEKVLFEQGASHLQELPLLLEKEGFDLAKVPYVDWQIQLGLYIKGFERVRLLQSLKDTKVDVFGSFRPKNNWEYYLKHLSHVRVHKAVSYQESLSLSSKAKISLDSSPLFKYGLHDRLFSGLMAGAMVFSGACPALEQSSLLGNGVESFDLSSLETLKERIEYFLKSKERQEQVKKGQKIVKDAHLWEHRAKEILGKMALFFP